MKTNDDSNKTLVVYYDFTIKQNYIVNHDKNFIYKQIYFDNIRMTYNQPKKKSRRNRSSVLPVNQDSQDAIIQVNINNDNDNILNFLEFLKTQDIVKIFFKNYHDFLIEERDFGYRNKYRRFLQKEEDDLYENVIDQIKFVFESQQQQLNNSDINDLSSYVNTPPRRGTSTANPTAPPTLSPGNLGFFPPDDDNPMQNYEYLNLFDYFLYNFLLKNFIAMPLIFREFFEFFYHKFKNLPPDEQTPRQTKTLTTFESRDQQVTPKVKELKRQMNTVFPENEKKSFPTNPGEMLNLANASNFPFFTNIEDYPEIVDEEDDDNNEEMKQPDLNQSIQHQEEPFSPFSIYNLKLKDEGLYKIFRKDIVDLKTSIYKIISETQPIKKDAIYVFISKFAYIDLDTRLQPNRGYLNIQKFYRIIPGRIIHSSKRNNQSLYTLNKTKSFLMYNNHLAGQHYDRREGRVFINTSIENFINITKINRDTQIDDTDRDRDRDQQIKLFRDLYGTDIMSDIMSDGFYLYLGFITSFFNFENNDTSSSLSDKTISLPKINALCCFLDFISTDQNVDDDFYLCGFHKCMFYLCEIQGFRIQGFRQVNKKKVQRYGEKGKTWWENFKKNENDDIDIFYQLLYFLQEYSLDLSMFVSFVWYNRTFNYNIERGIRFEPGLTKEAEASMEQKLNELTIYPLVDKVLVTGENIICQYYNSLKINENDYFTGYLQPSSQKSEFLGFGIVTGNLVVESYFKELKNFISKTYSISKTNQQNRNLYATSTSKNDEKFHYELGYFRIKLSETEPIQLTGIERYRNNIAFMNTVDFKDNYKAVGNKNFKAFGKNFSDQKPGGETEVFSSFSSFSSSLPLLRNDKSKIYPTTTSSSGKNDDSDGLTIYKGDKKQNRLINPYDTMDNQQLNTLLPYNTKLGDIIDKLTSLQERRLNTVEAQENAKKMEAEMKTAKAIKELQYFKKIPVTKLNPYNTGNTTLKITFDGKRKTS